MTRVAPRRVGRKPSDENYDGKTPLPDVKQELFCELYTASFTTFYGHGQNSYAFAYGFQNRIDDLSIKKIGASSNLGRGKNKKAISEHDAILRNIKGMEMTCRCNATRLLTKAHILARINFRLDDAAEDKIMDREAMRVVQQMFNLDAKMRAIERFDKIRGRIKDKIEIKHNFEPIEGFNYVKPQQPQKK